MFFFFSRFANNKNTVRLPSLSPYLSDSHSLFLSLFPDALKKTFKSRKEKKKHPKMPNVFISTSSSLLLLLPGVALKRRLARPRRSLVAVAVPRRGRVRRLRQRRRWPGGPGVRDAWRRQGTSSAGPSATPAAAVAVAGPLFSTAPPSSHSSHPKLHHFLDQRSPASEFVI